MEEQASFNRISGAIFAVATLAYAARLAGRREAVLGGRAAPRWASGAALLAAGTLAAWALRRDRRRGAGRIGARASAHRLVSSGPIVSRGARGRARRRIQAARGRLSG
ncbi:MAG: hypothetical protein HY554_02105 [Elusimicrobia bacterium]|nr:hypothetical protein [Elusimicrobiota bacterium]